MDYFAGVDIGSTMTKVVIMGQEVIASVVRVTKPEQRRLAYLTMSEALREANLSFDELTYVVATGYGRINVPFADKQLTEISCHARGVTSLVPGTRTIIDIGGQDCKGIKVAGGRVVGFVMNDKCAAGTGRFLELTARALGVKLEEMGELALTSSNPVEISSTCTVFAQQEVVSKLAEGVALSDILAGLHQAIASRILSLVNRLGIEPEVVVTGGGAKNIGLVKALERKLGFPIVLPPDPLLTGALGAALLGRDLVEKAQKEGSFPTRQERRLEEVKFFA
ncbi:MAG: 2-hydroxyglutaryl-CoA dehydratase [Chloroflexi bacterium]|nr:MAG: 2-hydroxyglutaryl-CoA dehydratase [Chloroflexota bacterium]